MKTPIAIIAAGTLLCGGLLALAATSGVFAKDLRKDHASSNQTAGGDSNKGTSQSGIVINLPWAKGDQYRKKKTSEGGGTSNR